MNSKELFLYFIFKIFFINFHLIRFYNYIDT